ACNIHQSVWLAPPPACHQLSSKRLSDGPHLGVSQFQFPFSGIVIRRTVPVCRGSWPDRDAASACFWSRFARDGHSSHVALFCAAFADGGGAAASAFCCRSEPRSSALGPAPAVSRLLGARTRDR